MTIFVWVGQGNCFTCGEYELSHKKYDKKWIIYWRGQKIGQAPLLYLAKLDVEEHAKMGVVNEKTRPKGRVGVI